MPGARRGRARSGRSRPRWSRRSRRGSASRPGARRADGSTSMHERDAVVHRDRQRLGTTHPAQPGGQRDRARQRSAELAPADLGEALVRSLQDALGADVDPRPGRHLAVHREAECLEPAELVPVAPLRNQVGVGEQHARRPLVGAEHADRLAGLDEHRLVGGECRQRACHRVEGVPAARRSAGTAVDDEVGRAFGDLGVEVVVQHPVRRFLRPPDDTSARCRAALAPSHVRSPAPPPTHRSPIRPPPARCRRRAVAPPVADRATASDRARAGDRASNGGERGAGGG